MSLLRPLGLSPTSCGVSTCTSMSAKSFSVGCRKSMRCSIARMDHAHAACGRAAPRGHGVPRFARADLHRTGAGLRGGTRYALAALRSDSHRESVNEKNRGQIPISQALHGPGMRRYATQRNWNLTPIFQPHSRSMQAPCPTARRSPPACGVRGNGGEPALGAPHCRLRQAVPGVWPQLGRRLRGLDWGRARFSALRELTRGGCLSGMKCSEFPRAGPSPSLAALLRGKAAERRSAAPHRAPPAA